MLIFGHAGITLGAAVFLNGALTKSYSLCAGGRASWLAALGNRIDIRLLLLGSLLPDIIDKPIGQFFFRDTFSSGRIFCHTLLFLLLITFAGLYLYRSYGKTWSLVLCFGTFTHLIFDQMWLKPRTLLWPLYGFAFEKIDLPYSTQNIPYALYTDPSVYVPEIVGVAILIWFVVRQVRRSKVYSFIRNGQV